MIISTGGSLRMPTFWKDVLKPGTYHLADGRNVTYTRDDVQHLAQRMREMRSAGVPVPVVWGHQDVRPMYEDERIAAKVKATVGHVDDVDLEGDKIRVLFDAAVDDDAKRLPAVKYVSPEILTDWTDGKGRFWPGKSITHVAITGNPVNPDQEPFRRADRFSYDVVRLSLDDLIEEGGTVADEKDDDKKEEKKDDSAKESKKDAPEGNGMDASVKDVADALREIGLNVPDEVVDFTGLIIAIKAGKGSMGGDEPPPDMPPDEPLTEEPSAVMMSLDARRNPLAAKVISTERENLLRRARALVGAGKQVTKKDVDALISELTSERLSLDKNADIVGGKALAKLEAYEALSGANPFRARMSNDAIREVPNTDHAREAEEKELRELARKNAESVSAAPRGHRKS